MSGLVLRFLASGAVVVLAGVALAKAGDQIAAATRVGRVWVGALLLAGATSLPELATDLTAVRIGAPDLAAGDLFGSSMANMLILALVDLLTPRRRLLRTAAFEHVMAGSLALVLNGLAAAFVLARFQTAVLGMGLDSLLLLFLYLLGARAIYRHGLAAGRSPSREASPAGEPVPPRVGVAVARFGGATLAILLAAPVFARSADGIASATGLGDTFVGTLLVGLATSLPELASTVAAVRIGAPDLAVANLFGSNGFNMAVFPLLDLADGPRPIFAGLDPAHALSGILGMVLMGLGLAALVYRSERRYSLHEPGSLGMVAVYALAVWLLYAHAAGRL